MTSRPAAVTLVCLLLLGYTLAAVAGARADRLSVAASAIERSFGPGWLGGCFMRVSQRETGGTFDPRATNWADHHSDGSRGSFGLLQIGALWRRHGETVGAFARRMWDPYENARLARRLYDRYGLQPWGGRC